MGREQLRPWLSARAELPVGLLFCIIDGPTRGRPWSSAAVRSKFRRTAARAGVLRRFAPHQLRHAHALELTREGVPLNIIQRQRFLDAQAGAPKNDDHRSQPPAVAIVGRVAHDRHDLIDRRWVGRVAHALVARWAAGVVAGQCRRRATPPRGVERW